MSTGTALASPHRSPFVAFLFGTILGALGVGLYLRSVKEGLIAFGIMVLLGTLLPGIGLLFSLLLTGAYGAYRADAANRLA